MANAILEVDSVAESIGPIFTTQAGTVQETAHSSGEVMVGFLSHAVLCRTVCTSKLKSITGVLDYFLELFGAAKFLTLVGTDVAGAGGVFIFGENVLDKIKGWLLGLGEVDPYVSGCFINDEAIGAVTIFACDQSSLGVFRGPVGTLDEAEVAVKLLAFFFWWWWFWCRLGLCC